MKKQIAAFIACAMLSSYAYAAEATFDRTSETVTISGNAKAGEVISVVVLKSGASIGEIKNSTELKANTQLFYEFTAGEDGSYAETLNLGGESGVYTILLSGSDVKETLSAETFSKKETEEYLKKLSDAAEGNSVKAALEDARLRTVLGLDELYEDETMREELIDLLTKKKEFNDLSDVESVRKPMQERKDCLNELNSMINKAQVKDLIKKIYSLLETNDSAYTKYMQMKNTDSVDTRIFNAKPYKNLQAVCTQLKSAIDESGKSSGGSSGGSGGGSGSSGKGAYAPGNVIKADTGNNAGNNSENKAKFKDVPDGHWAKESIEYLSDKGVVSGKTEDSFCPEETVKREEFVKMLVSALGFEIGDESDSFTDTDKSAWYSKYLCAAYKAGLVRGKDDGSFGIGETLARQDMAAMVFRAMKNTTSDGQKISFEDYDSVSDYAKESVDILSAMGVISGTDNKFLPHDTATRAQAAQIICKVMKLEEIQ